MWKPRRLTTLWAFTACYGISLPFFNFYSSNHWQMCSNEWCTLGADRSLTMKVLCLYLEREMGYCYRGISWTFAVSWRNSRFGTLWDGRFKFTHRTLIILYFSRLRYAEKNHSQTHLSNRSLGVQPDCAINRTPSFRSRLTVTRLIKLSSALMET
jgi:hypothetical protein